MDRVLEINAYLEGGRIVAAMDYASIAQEVMDSKKIVVLKNVFPKNMLLELRQAILRWGNEIEASTADDFRGNYHRQRVMISRIQQAPHVFHDYNFNTMSALDGDLQDKLTALFEPLRSLYNALTGYNVEFAIPEAGPYVHPQVIHYPSGGGFFGRHWHNLLPQMMGFIVSLAEYGKDFKSGATVFDIDGDIVNMEGRQQVGDICIWRYDYDHWVTQSNLEDKFDWNSKDGRWVATFAYFDPKG
jgi:hypothetical protein